ncbi:MAG: hypothetical protein ACK4GT_00220 [Pararhodobacter sp.]
MAERLASFDYRGLGLAMRQKLEGDGRGWRACAAEIGVTATDLSRVAAGQPVAAHKVIAICDWIGVEPREWYRAASAVSRKLFHGERTETGGPRQ